jgi:hypothetical protein
VREFFRGVALVAPFMYAALGGISLAFDLPPLDPAMETVLLRFDLAVVWAAVFFALRDR